MALTQERRLVLETLREHAADGGEAISTKTIDVELNRRHNRWYGYDQLFSLLKRAERVGLVKRDASRPARWSLTDAGRDALG